MRLSRLASSVQGSITLKINEMAAQLRAQGEPVIHLGGGEPVSKAPHSAIEAGQSVLATGEIRYGPEDGLKALKEGVCEYTRAWYGVEARPDHVCISAGTKQALMVALQSVLDADDEAIILAPYWPSYTEMVRVCGAAAVVVRPDEQLNPSLKRIAAAISPRTRAIVVNSPNNPSGVVYERGFIAELVQLAEARGLWLLVDDIYQRLLFDDRKPLSVYEFSRRKLEDSQIVLLNGVSKAYAMTGFRIGWAVANPELRRAMGSLQGQQTSGPSTLCQQAALAALRGPQESVTELVRHLEANRERMMSELKRIPGLRCAAPGGAFYCFPDFSSLQPDSVRLAQFLLEAVRVVTVPGESFGMEGHLRLSTCGAAQAVSEGPQRIAWALDPSGSRETTIGGVRFVRNW